MMRAWPFLLCQNPIVAVSPWVSGDGGVGVVTVTVALAVAVAGIPHAVPVAVATLVSVSLAGPGVGVMPPLPIFGGELWTVVIRQSPNPADPNAALLTTTEYEIS